MSKRRKKHHDDHEEHPSEAWLIALADMMTLLMVTFLMMFAIAIVDLQKFKQFSQAFAEATGQHVPPLTEEPNDQEVDPSKSATEAEQASAAAATPVLDREDLQKLKEKIQAAINRAGLQQEIDVTMDPRGLILYVTSGVLFDSGKAQLTPTGQDLLVRLGPVFSGIGNDLVVEGHTDSRPISSAQFPSNWELSTARATAVVRHLADQAKIDVHRLTASGFADTRPRKKGKDLASLSANRRVDIVVEAPPPPPPAAPAATAKEPAAGTSAPEPATEEGDGH